MAGHQCQTIPNIKTLTTAWDAQFLLRFHTVAMQAERQTVGAHSYAVSILIDQLWPDSTKQLIMASLYHDVPELILGDIPATAKWSYPEVQKAFEDAEKKVFEDLGLIFVLTADEKNRLKMADMLELVLYSNRHTNQSEQMKVIMHTGINFLYKRFSDLPDFEPVNKVLTHYNLSV
jgi:5'-deoxynucleotidase YfbR-like HD superfamily hydrolase